MGFISGGNSTIEKQLPKIEPVNKPVNQINTQTPTIPGLGGLNFDTGILDKREIANPNYIPPVENPPSVGGKGSGISPIITSNLGGFDSSEGGKGSGKTGITGMLHDYSQARRNAILKKMGVKNEI